VAFAIGECRRWDQAALLARLARENVADPWMQSAILSSAAACGGELFGLLAADARWRADSASLEFLRQLVLVIGAQNRRNEVAQAIEQLARWESLDAVFPVASALAEGLKRAGTSLAAVDSRNRLKPLFQQAKPIASNTTQPRAVRRAAIEALGLLPYADAAPALLGLLERAEPEPLQMAAIATLDQFRDAEIGAELIKHLGGLKGAVRARALDALLQRPERLEALWLGFAQRLISSSDLSARQRDMLRKHRDQKVREQATRFLGAANPAARQDVYAAFFPALQLSGVAARGKAVFESRCAGCHQYAGIGQEFGPDLTAARAGGREKLLASIVDPNREVLPSYFIQTIELKDGETVAGLIRNETATTVTLRQPGGVERTLSRTDIASVKTTVQSLMPEGLEAGLSVQDMADLIQFILGTTN
jgi:putative heme-binding domain-containing protein